MLFFSGILDFDIFGMKMWPVPILPESPSSYMPMVTNISMSLIFQNLIHKACSRVEKFSFCLQG